MPAARDCTVSYQRVLSYCRLRGFKVLVACRNCVQTILRSTMTLNYRDYLPVDPK